MVLLFSTNLTKSDSLKSVTPYISNLQVVSLLQLVNPYNPTIHHKTLCHSSFGKYQKGQRKLRYQDALRIFQGDNVG